MSTSVLPQYPPFAVTASLPPAPPARDLIAAVEARLEAIARDVLPAVRTEREQLVAACACDAPDAEILYREDGPAIVCHLRDADDIASALASEAASSPNMASPPTLTSGLLV